MPRRPRNPYGSRWQVVRIRILNRDRFECQIRADGCTGKADQVDHIVAVADGGNSLDPANLRAACTHCNTARGRGSVATPPSQDWGR